MSDLPSWNPLYKGTIQAINDDGSNVVQYDTGLLKTMVLSEMIHEGAAEVGSSVMATKNRPGDVDQWFDVERGKELGRGQFAVAFRCVDKHSKSVKAVKQIDRSQYKGDPAREMDEVRLMQKIHHPRCVGIEEIFVTPKEVQAIAEIMEGGDLMHYLIERMGDKAEWLSEGEAGGCFHAVVDGVAYLHAHNLCHRDLKPENILLQKKGDVLSVRVADFGFAKFIPEDGHLTSTGLGTFGYVAPEIIARKARYDGMLCDLWSLGVILFILVAGNAPFKLGGASAADKAKVMKADYKFGKEWKKAEWQKYPQEIVAALLKVNPQERMKAEEIMKYNWVANDGKFVPGWTYDPNSKPRLQAAKAREGTTTPKAAAAPKDGKRPSGKTPGERPKGGDETGCGCLLQ